MTEDWWQKRLSDYREKVRKIDHEVLGLISKRMKVCLKIGEIKEYFGKPIFDPEQEKRVLEDKASIRIMLGLKEDFVKELISLVINYSKELQYQKRGSLKNKAKYFKEVMVVGHK